MPELLQQSDQPRLLLSGKPAGRAGRVALHSKRSIRRRDKNDFPSREHQPRRYEEDGTLPRGERLARTRSIDAEEAAYEDANQAPFELARQYQEAYREYSQDADPEDIERFFRQQRAVDPSVRAGLLSDHAHPVDMGDNRPNWTYGDPAKVVPRLQQESPRIH